MSSSGTGKLRLAAIVFTDIVGYSAVVHRNPALGRRLLDRQRGVVRRQVAACGGREVETAGDSFLLVFDSAWAALQCVADIQRGLARANQDAAPDEPVRIRAGIHLGDVEERGAEIYGDGVNISARILPFSPEDGVAYSDAIHRQVHNRLHTPARALGPQTLKNIAQPVEVYTLDYAALLGIESGVPAKGAPVPAAVHPALYGARDKDGGRAAPDLLWKVAGAQLDERSLELSVGGEPLELERKSLEVLRHLLWHAGEVVTKEELLDAVWPGRVIGESALQKCVARVREALRDEREEIIQTVRGYGYRLAAEVSVEHTRSAASGAARMEFKTGDSVPLRPQWRLLERLGAGGHGEAWLAEHEKTHERRAYKFALSVDSLVALKREITLYRLLHDTLGERRDLVRLIDWNLEQEPYFTEAEYVAGGNLQGWAEAQGGLAAVPQPLRIALAAQIAETLAAAHSVAVLHKDLKPTNVFIGADADGAPAIKLADFGSGAVLNLEKLDQLGITRLGFTQLIEPGDSTTGTPLYLAPEVLAGQPATVQADIYALGVMLYQLVVGDLRKPLAPAWEQDVEDELLREDIAAAAHGNPKKRLADASALARRLRSLEQRRVQREQERAEQRRLAQAQQALERFRARRSGLLVAVVFLVLGLAVSLRLYYETRSAQRQAEQQAAEAEAASAFLMRDVLSGLDPGQHDVKQLAAAKELLDAGASKIDQRFARQPVLAAKVRHRFILAYYSLGFVGEGVRLGEQVRGQAQHALDVGLPEAVELGLLLAEDAPNIAIREQDQPYWERLRDAAQRAWGERDPRLLRIRFVLGLLLAERGDYPAAREELAQVAQAAAATADEHFIVEVYGAWSSVLADLGEMELAESTLRGAIERAAPVFGANSAPLLAQRARLAHLMIARGQYAEAGQELERDLATARQTRAPGNTLVVELSLTQGELLAEQGRYDEARAVMEPALALYAAGTPPDDAVLLAFEAKLARLELWSGRAGAAQERLRRILAAQTVHDAADSVRLASTRIALADALRQAGKPDQARQQLQSVPASTVQRIQASAPGRAELQRVQARIDLAQGRIAEGRAGLQAALEQERKMYGGNHLWLRQAEQDLAKAQAPG